MRRRKAGYSKGVLSAQASDEDLTCKLPLMHVTTVGAARDILAARQLEVSKCDVFEKELLYFFLARPDYRFKHGDEKREFLSYFPVVLIFNPETVARVYHVYPFDTGGASAGLFDDQSDEYSLLEDYELSPNLEAAYKHVAWAFGNVENYLKGNVVLKANEIPAFESVVQSFIAIAGMASEGSNKPDKRASSIEIATEHNVLLEKNLSRIIVPSQMLSDMGKDNTEIIAILNELDVQVEVYAWEPNSIPNEKLYDLRDTILSGLLDAQ
ncbi:hypothetical protein [Ponticaulis sp.]|uniref:hypothetical protein n=1 Tax=Ponticaulis sp. TaxID=2020902 RepID=UPI000B6AA38D|nr:hypothetical protein [Ponticaulis sp.]RPG18713.1 MAG: hypothetical protein CBC85_000300 [Hyphomonadaceae bacterium TMED125]HBH89453.1 hypothetical protein [Hyphomonadaceae bacterium]|tara:strand:- start:26160 stop:26963 length:804 start_codon:yes stop_codon:yes gene_type:complete